MAKCFYCGDQLKGYPFVCRLCDEGHCGKHRLPENHECLYIEVYRSTSYRKTQLSKNREMKRVKKTGSYAPQGTSSGSGFSSPLRTTSTKSFNTLFFGEQTIHFSQNSFFSSFAGGMIFALSFILYLVFESILNRFEKGIYLSLGILVIGGLGFTFLYIIRRLVASRYHISTQFGIWPLGILITLITTLFTFTFYVFGFFDDRGGTEHSRAMVSITGIVSSFGVWAIGAFGIPYFLQTVTITSSLVFLILFIMSIVFQQFIWWGIVNLLPFGFLDGKKVYDYNPGYFVALVILAFVCYFSNPNFPFYLLSLF